MNPRHVLAGVLTFLGINAVLITISELLRRNAEKRDLDNIPKELIEAKPGGLVKTMNQRYPGGER